jgi:hypothetical protein
VFSLWLLRSECEFLCGNFDDAARLISELIERAASKAGTFPYYVQAFFNPKSRPNS